tara:strand:- start:185 stop:454 length:270 start_codon:yes stop_codon:yes gene_type:complete
MLGKPTLKRPLTLGEQYKFECLPVHDSFVLYKIFQRVIALLLDILFVVNKLVPSALQTQYIRRPRPKGRIVRQPKSAFAASAKTGRLQI